MQAINVAIGDGGHLQAPHRRQDVGLDLLLVALLGPLPLPRQVLVLESFAEIGHGRRRSQALMFTNRVGAAVNQPLQPLGFFPRRTRAPVGKRADRPAPLAAIALTPVIQDEGAAPRP